LGNGRSAREASNSPQSRLLSNFKCQHLKRLNGISPSEETLFSPVLFIPLGWGLGDISKVAMGLAKSQARLSAWGATEVCAFGW
jgi:hypothetical protein